MAVQRAGKSEGCCDANYLINWKGWVWLASVLFFAGIMQSLGITLYFYRWTMTCNNVKSYFLAMPDWGYCCNEAEVAQDTSEDHVQCISWYSDAWEDYVDAFNPERTDGIHPDVEGFAKCSGGFSEYEKYENMFYLGIFDEEFIPDTDTAQTMVDYLSILCVSLAMSFFTGIMMLLAAFSPWDRIRHFIKHFGSGMLIVGGIFELVGVMTPTVIYYDLVQPVSPDMTGTIPDGCGNAFGENGIAIAIAVIAAAAVFATASYIRFPPVKILGITVSEKIVRQRMADNEDGYMDYEQEMNPMQQQQQQQGREEEGEVVVKPKKKKKKKKEGEGTKKKDGDNFQGNNPMHDAL
jgi:hypothetical protein